MNWREPVLIQSTAGMTAFQRLNLFFGYHDLRVYLTDQAFIDIGAGSLHAAAQVSLVSGDHVGSLGSIGRWCEISPRSEIMSRGEHDNDALVNIGFNSLRMLAKQPNDYGMKPTAPIKIGNAVVIGAGVQILSGAEVGDGAVVGAGATVTKKVEPFTIVAGIPAKPIRQRQRPAARWWDFSTAYLLENLSSLETVAASDGPHEYRSGGPRFAVRKTDDAYSILGMTHGDAIVQIPDWPAAQRDYIAQALQLESPHWRADWPQ